MAGLLDGIKVLEIANWVAAPSACAILADLGAEVTKIEHAQTGDPVRNLDFSVAGIVPYTGGLNPSFELLNRGKESLGINLESLQGQEVVRKLAADSDVLVTNLVPRRQARYGLRYEDISPLNPRIIYVALTGYGMEGAERDRLGFDYAAFWARSGIMATLGEEGEPPVQQRPAMGDQTTSLALTTAIGMALFERERSGMGQRIDCSLLHTALWVLGTDVMASLKARQAVQRNARLEVRNPLANFYQAREGKWLQLVMFEADRFWPGFCRALEIEHLIQDPLFASIPLRAENNRELMSILRERFASKTRSEWGERLDQEACIWAPIQTLDEVIVDPQIGANSYITTLSHAEEGEFEIVSAPLKLQRTPATVRTPAPALGQHTEMKLLTLGYTWEEIADLKEQGAII